MKIMAIEIDRTIFHSLQHPSLAQRYDVEAVSAEGAAIALEKATDVQYDLIILDNVAAEPDGFALSRRLQMLKGQTPILLLTAPDDNPGTTALKAGADDYLVKPFSARAMADRLDFLVRRHERSTQPVGQNCLAVGDRTHKTENNPALTKRNLQRLLDEERLVAKISDSIRRTLDLPQILKAAVSEVHGLLQTDRVVVFRFESHWQGIIEAESVSHPWKEILALKVKDDCLANVYVGEYRLGRVSAIPDIEAGGIDPYHKALLQSLQVRANLVVPVLQGDNLWGLLIAHHCCAPRQWTDESIQLLKQVAAQLGIAIQQAELYQTTRRELLERRRVQSALAQSEERFRLLSAFAPVGIYQTDVEGHCTYTNDRWQKTAGLTLEESLGDGWIQAIYPDDRERVFSAWTRLVNREKEFALEFRFVDSEGAVRWVAGRAIAMQDKGQTVGYVGVNEDITERKLAEQKIREQAALIDIASDAIFVRDIAGKIMFWSRGAERLYGWSAEEAIGKIASQILKKNPAELKAALSAVKEQGFWQGELCQTTKSGDEILVASRWTLVKDERDRPQSFLEVNTDITEKKRLEAQFYQAQRLESLGRLAGGIAHDLGNVLTPVLGIAQLLRVTQTEPDEATQNYIDILEKSARRGVEMVKQILTFAQGGAGNETTVDIVALLQEVLAVARQGLPSSIEISQAGLLASRDSADKDGPPTATIADSTHLHQVFMNLCINARDAMPKGGVLSLSVERCYVDAAMAKKHLDATVGNYVVVTVADTGTGISPKLCDRIFDPFFTTKAPDKGTGLGLSTAAGIVKKIGGFISAVSEVGRGTQMKVYLRAMDADSKGVLETAVDG